MESTDTARTTRPEDGATTDENVSDPEVALAQESPDGIPVYCAFRRFVKLADLRPNPENPNTHPAQQIELLANVLRSYGWRAPITVSLRSGLIVRGHGRLEAARKAGLSWAPVDEQHYASKADEDRDLVADNRLAELAHVDDRKLLSMLKTLDEPLRLGAGFTDRSMLAMLRIAGETTGSSGRGTHAEKKVFSATASGTCCTVLIGSCIDTLPTIPPESVDLVFTSPPYYAKVPYDGVCDWPKITYDSLPGVTETVEAMRVTLGMEKQPEDYIGHMVHVFRLIRPALRPGASAFLNITDTYAETTKFGQRSAEISEEGNRIVDTSHGGSVMTIEHGQKNGDMMMIPARVAMALSLDGWYLKSEIIWHCGKRTPRVWQNRVQTVHETIYHLTLQTDYCFNANAANDAEGRLRSTVWHVQARRDAPVRAAFPAKLPEIAIDLACPEGGTVLDPFAGSGTTLSAAMGKGRSAIGCEIDTDALKIIADTISEHDQECSDKILAALST